MAKQLKKAAPKNLVIVESPAKARTLARILGSSYEIKASLGHVRDLPKARLGVDVDRDFAPDYQIIREKKGIVAELKEAAERAEKVYLATDPDREGEAISWHLVQAAGLGRAPVHRVEFHEITPQAVARAFRHPRDIDTRLVQAQQARRILDRLVGYKISPLLAKKVQRGLSAGRVQSAALRLVADREREIRGFVTTEYWTIEAELAKRGDGQGFRASLIGPTGSGPLDIPDEEASHKLVAELERAEYRVSDVQVKDQARHPAPPFTTSTLQQEAWRKLHFSARRTMALAQQLYEGLPLGPQGSVGLITYMRTDSTRVAAPAVQEARGYIRERFGAPFLPPSPRLHKRKAKGAQEAHEAIRPTSVRRLPQEAKPFLTLEQFKLYQLIWNRMVASQMASAALTSTTVHILARGPERELALRASATQVKFPGFLVLYSEGRDEAEEERANPLPPLSPGDALDLLGLHPEQHFTQPPPRYTDASLVKALEENGIGRPSTYAPILAILEQRRYVAKDKGRFMATDLGLMVSDLLSEHFAQIVDMKFTAQMEDGLDQVARGQQDWVPMLRQFYSSFHQTVLRAAQNMKSVKAADEPLEETCLKCGQPMVIRQGRFGRFIACTGFPKCKNTRPLPGEGGKEQATDQVCEQCGQPMVIKQGRFGKFLSCSAYPGCKNTRPMPTGARCPLCGGELVERRTKSRRRFYGCSKYPQCKFTQWQRPQPQAVAQVQSP